MVKCLQEIPFALIDAGKIFENTYSVSNLFLFLLAPAQGCQGYALEGGMAHEAGYDAYLTGICFIAMVKYLGKPHNLKSLGGSTI